jgi:hypothetical protein
MDERLIKTLKKVLILESGRSAVIATNDAEECEDHGWLEAQPGGGYRLTDAGRKKLADQNSN